MVPNFGNAGSIPATSTKYNGLKHEGRNNIVAIKRIRPKLQISQLDKYESR